MTARGTDGHGRTSADREAARQSYIDAAVQRARYMGLSMRCEWAHQWGRSLNDPEHGMCRGESRGGAGCLCQCHDPAAEVIEG